MPAPLAALLAATALLGVAWTLVTPPFQTPDEPAHVAYVQSLAERGALPGDADRPSWSSEQTLASDAANADQTAQVASTKPTWSEQAYARWRRSAERLPERDRSDGGGPNFAGSNPPLYYLWSVVPYQLASDGDLFARITAMRLGSLLFLLLTVVATWLLAGVVLGPRRELQLAAAAVPALLPMVTFIGASVSPDSLMYALWTIALWLGARILRGHGGLLDHAALVAVTGASLATKAASYALVPAVLLVLAVALWRLRHRRRLVAAIVAAGVATLTLTAGAWFVVAGTSDRPAARQLTDALELPETLRVAELGSYVWQYYLPRLPFQTPYTGIPDEPAGYDIWFKGSLGAFGWLEVRPPEAVYTVLSLLAWALLVAAVVALVRRRSQLDLPLLCFLALATLGLFAGLHWNEYKLAEEQGMLVNQGRYLFPLVGLAGLTAGAALVALPRRARAAALGTFLGGLGALQLYSIGLMAVRFYA